LKNIVFVANVDWFFISHRLPLAIEALKRGYSVTLVTKNTGYKSEIEEQNIRFIDIDFERSGKNPIKELLIILKLRKIYHCIQPDIIHHITLKPSIYGTIAARRAKVPSIVINAVSGLGYLFTDNRKSISTKILMLLLKRAFGDKKSNFIFQNPDDKDLYRKLGFLNENNYIIIKGAGVNENIFQYIEPKTANRVNVTLLARMLKDKGVLEFIAAAEILRPEFEDKAEFILAGGIDVDNPTHITEKELTNKCDGNYIKWLGHINNVKLIYEQSDIVCLPSYREGLPKSLIEAMAVGRPIVTTDAIGCRECVDDGINGYLVPVKNADILADKIKDLISDPELRLKMGLQSREKMVNGMSLKKIVEQTFSFYARKN
jgi:glycosyltransferase involved in cell wall biosynthesis